MSSNDRQVEEVGGCIIGLGIRSGNKTGGGGAKIDHRSVGRKMLHML